MAFLLSPKTGGAAVSYVFISSGLVSINGGEAHQYTLDEGATVAPGDVVTAPGAMSAYYYASLIDEEADPVKTVDTSNTYTVETVPTAIGLRVEVHAS